jgi:hypothetical protein
MTGGAHQCDWVAYWLVSSIRNFEQEQDALHPVGTGEPLSSFTSSSQILSRKYGSLDAETTDFFLVSTNLNSLTH